MTSDPRTMPGKSSPAVMGHRSPAPPKPPPQSHTCPRKTPRWASRRCVYGRSWTPLERLNLSLCLCFSPSQAVLSEKTERLISVTSSVLCFKSVSNTYIREKDGEEFYSMTRMPFSACFNYEMLGFLTDESRRSLSLSVYSVYCC